METKPKFKVSYRGAADYTFQGREYVVRSFAHDDGHYNGNYYETGIEPFVGCVSDRREFHTFPPQEVIEAFQEEHPGIVGAKYAEDSFKDIEYTDHRQIWIKENDSTVYAGWMEKYFHAPYVTE